MSTIGGTQMTLAIFVITMFELVMFFFQIIYFMERPNDKKRLLYLLLLIFLLAYNICSGLFPDPNIPIPLMIQTVTAYLVGFSMSMYVVYYFYRAFELHELKFFTTYGSLLFLLVPFVFLFVVPYYLTSNLDLSRRLTVVIPFLYGLAFIYSTRKALLTKIKDSKSKSPEEQRETKIDIASAFIALICWAALPMIVFFGDFQILEQSVTNAGFFIMSVSYIRSSISKSKKEYRKLLANERELTELNEDLKSKVEERTQRLTLTFINLAHETKTPLTLINNYLEQIVERYGSDCEEIRNLKYNVQRLTTDIVNFFDIEKFKKGVYTYDHNQNSDFSSILYFKLSLFKVLALKKNIQLNDEIATDCFVRSHPSAIERVINNLVENAIKYTPEGGLIKVSLKGTTDNNIVFTVADTGSGIPKEFQEKIFEPYYQLGIPRKYNQGMGMGLSIVKKIVEEIGGVVSLSSGVNNGAVFTVTLGRYFPNPDELSCYHANHESPSLFFASSSPIEDHICDQTKPFILLVEDNYSMMNYLYDKLIERYNVYVATNGKEAVKKLEVITKLDMIISDVMMDEMDGYEFCSEVSKDSRHEHIPFIFLTARNAPTDKLIGLKLGAVDYIEKPFLIAHLMHRIESLLTKFQKQRDAIIERAYKNLLIEPSSTDSSGSDRISIGSESMVSNSKSLNLTEREIEIAQLMAKGLSNKGIASQLTISFKTVNSHIAHIFEKAGVSNRLELINKLTARA